jgi:hypothetical protein
MRVGQRLNTIHAWTFLRLPNEIWGTLYRIIVIAIREKIKVGYIDIAHSMFWHFIRCRDIFQLTVVRTYPWSQII